MLDGKARSLCALLLTGDPEAALILADWLLDHGDDRADFARSFQLPLEFFVHEVYWQRKNRCQFPQGTYSSGRIWLPSASEEAGDIVSRVKKPPGTPGSHPLAYLSRARTKQHCRVLCLRALQKQDVPPDILIAYERMIQPSIHAFFYEFPELAGIQ